MFKLSSKIQFKWILSGFVLLALQACSGGSGGGASDREGEVSSSDVSDFVYSGDAPANTEIQNFKTSFYDNVVIRCGGCHTTGGTGTTAFVDNDDVNFAWAEAKTVADLVDPSASAVVTRVENGHNCWLSSDASCAAAMTGYVERWAAGASQSVSTVTLIPRDPQELAGLKILPIDYVTADAALSYDLTDEGELLGLLQTYCSDCHSGSSATPQSPYFASDDASIAYAAMSGKVDLVTPANSRFVIKVAGNHNCWSDCGDDAEDIEEAIERFAAEIPEVEVDSDLVISMAQVLEEDGIIASGGGRYEDDVIAKWEFREGDGDLVADTSGVQPEIPLTVLGEFEWYGGWGVSLTGGRAVGAVSGSTKLYDRLSAAGEYTIEAWVVPNNVTQEDAWIVGYAGGPEDRNLLLTQTLYNYDFYNRSNANIDEADGGPAVSTDDDDEIAQATLQHVVLTYDPINGRKIYVNGVDTGAVDEIGGGVLSNWNDAFAVVLGNNFSGSATWQGVIRMVAIHGRSLTEAQIIQNYDVGVGQKYYLMFGVSDLVDEDSCQVTVDGETTDYCYIVFEVSQFDSYSYLFRDPRFVNINPEGSGNVGFDLKGIYLGLNGQLAVTGQGFVNVNTTISGSSFTIEDEPLQSQGTIVPLENGSDKDVFFLAFENIDGNQDQREDEAAISYSYIYPESGNEFAQIGLRTFDEVNQTYSWVTGIAIDNHTVSDTTSKTVSETFETVRESLASVATFDTYMASHQMAVTQLAAAYCDALVEDTTLREDFFNDGSTAFDFSSAVEDVSDDMWSDQIIYPLIDNIYASGLDTQPSRTEDDDDADGMADRSNVHDELLDLIIDTDDAADEELTIDGKTDGLKYCSTSPCPDGRTAEVVKAVCTAVLASAPALMK
jgi:mono/diheme cytochrome c family protein